jgi:N-acyl-L-homoserine lactone synthetase
MIRIIDGRLRHRFPEEIDAMHRIRKKVFFDRMKWQVSVINNWEIDGYDALSPVYLVCVNDQNKVVGGLRLLPTMGFTMINDTFSVLLPNSNRVESPLIWESSRFSVDHEADVVIGKKGLSRAAAELGLAMNEIGIQTGLTHIVTVYDAFMHRMLKRAGCAGVPIGPPQMIGDVLTYAVFFEVGAESERAARRASEIETSVFEDPIKVQEMNWAA